MSKIKAIVLFILLFNALTGKAQYYDIGQEPSRIRWNQIKTKNFKVIYPDYYQKQARKTAQLLEQWRLPVSASLKVNPLYTPVILHTGNLNSNAFTIWAPRRLEFLTIPPQDIYSQSWTKQLVLHEYRHLVQISKVNQGFTKALSVIFGQQAAPAIIGLFIPPWFLEGDAVATETALSHTGRGRVADFAMPLRAQIKEKGPYHYTKQTLGSFKDFVPDHYVIGYHIVASSRAMYSYNLWNTALDRTAKYPYTLNPFSKGIRLVAGVNKKDLYNESIKYLDSIWTSNKSSNYKPVTIHRTKVYTNYIHPFYFGENIIALKSSLAEISKFVIIDKQGNEEVLYTPGYLFEDEVSFNGKWITWVERRPHVRWDNQSFSTIIGLNPQTKDIIKIRTNNRFFAPVLSPNNKIIAVSHVSVEGQNYLTLLDFQGKILSSTPSPNDMFISSPAWSSDGSQIVFIITGDEGKQLVIFDTGRHVFRTLTPFTTDQISDPQFFGRNILFNMDVNEKSELCSYDTISKEITLLSSSSFGTKYPYWENSGKDSSILLSYYTSNGYRIGELTAKDRLKGSVLFNDSIHYSSINNWPLAAYLEKEEAAIAKPTPVEDSITSNYYSKGAHLFHFHSWAPVYIDIASQTVRPGVSLMSQNLLSTMFVLMGYDYNTEEKTGQLKADITWKGWYPEITSSFSYGSRSDYAGNKDSVYRFTWKEASWDLGIRQWINTLSGKFSIGGFVETQHQLVNNSHQITTPHNFRLGTTGAMNYRIYAYALSKTAFRDLAPPLGLVIDVHLKNSLYGDYKAGDMTVSQLRMYLPGLVRNHSFQIYGAYQKLSISSDGYRFSGDIGTPAGYHQSTPGKLFRLRPSYSFPLVYPDIHAGTAFYLKRLRLNAFYDYFRGENKEWRTYSSIGADLIADFHLFSLPPPISAGIRASWLPENKSTYFSLIFNWDFTQY